MVFNQSFSENLKQWAIVCPWGSAIVEKMEKPGASFDNICICDSLAGPPNIIRKTDEGDYFVHSQQDPIAEANLWFSRLPLKNVNLIYVYGIGLGYGYDAVRGWLSKSRDNIVVFIEDNLEIIKLFLQNERAEEFLFNTQSFLYFVGDGDYRVETMRYITQLFVDKNPIVTGLESYISTKNSIFSELKGQISFFNLINSSLKTESVKSHGAAFFNNHVRNFLRLSSDSLATGLIGKFSGIPAIICGAGPSLNKNADILATLTDHALIIAGGTGLNALNAKGIMPHFGAGVDPNDVQFTRLIMNNAFDIPFIYTTRMLPSALEVVHGDKILVAGKNESGDKWVEDKLGISTFNIEQGFNVLNFATSLLAIMGCNPIICVGVDLAYSEGDSYASGIESHPLHDRIGHFRTKDEGEELVVKPDIYGKPVHTLWKWIAESCWYSSFGSLFPNVKLINATEGGIGFVGVDNMTLADVKERFLAKEYAISAYVHGEIQNSPFSDHVEYGTVRTIFLEMIEQLSIAAEKCGTIARLLKQYSESSDAREKKVEAEKLIKDFIELDIYKNLLNSLNDSYTLWNGLCVKQLEIESYKLSRDEQDQRHAAIESDRYQFLKDIALIGMNRICKALDEEVVSQDQVSDELENAASWGDKVYDASDLAEEKYVFDGKQFKILDIDLDINYVGDLANLQLRKEVIAYPSGNTKMECYYKNNILHGPSTYYGDDNKVLARYWFVDGKREGRAVRRYIDGEIYSIEAYRSGLKVGTHRYFYKDGKIRSCLGYLNGQLHGDVLLFHANGRMFRRLNFQLGKREGKEQIWYRNGRLHIEAEYRAGKPTGVARKWHQNGILAKEIVYQDSGEAFDIKSWDDKGVPISKPADTQTDYFDTIASKAGMITASMETVINNLEKVTGFLGEHPQEALERTTGGENVEAILGSFKELQQKMQHLRDVEGLLNEQLETDLQGSKEAIWKSPATKDIVSKQIDDMSQVMNSEMKTIEENMKKIITAIKNKTNE